MGGLTCGRRESRVRFFARVAGLPRRAVAFATLASAAVLLSGCAVKRERYDVPEIALPGEFQHKASAIAPRPAQAGKDSSPPSATSSVGSPAQTPLAQDLDKALVDWWKLLGSSELDMLVERALGNNHDLRVAVLRIIQARARADQADADRYPVVTVPVQSKIEAPEDGIGTVTSRSQIHSRKTHQIALRGDWRVDIWGERQSLFESSNLQVLRTAFQHDDTRRQMVGGVVTAYVDYLSLNDRLRIARESEIVLSEMLLSVEQRLNKGDATITDLEQQRAAVFTVRATIPALEQQRTESMNNLALLVGAVPGSLILSDRGLDSLYYPDVLPGMPAALLLRRPDVRMMESRLLSADADIDVARTRVLPPLDLSAQVGYGSYHWSTLLKSHSLFWNAIANLSATIFDYGKRDREVDFARAVHEELTESYVRVIYSAVREVEDSLNAVNMSGKRFNAQREAVNASRRAWQYSRESYLAGAIDYLALLDTERTYHRNLDDLHIVRRDRYRGLSNLFSALGGGTEQSAPLPGDGRRPVPLAGGQQTGMVLASMTKHNTVDGWDIADGSAWGQKGAWLIELAGVVDRAGIAATWRDLRDRFPKLMEGRFVLRRLLWNVKGDSGKQTAWYRVFIARFESAEQAEALCAELHASQTRCRLVPTQTLGEEHEPRQASAPSAEPAAASPPPGDINTTGQVVSDRLS